MTSEKPKAWEISPFTTEAAAGKLQFAPEVRIADCTLRDGEQQAGIVLTAEDKLEIAHALDDLGVYDIEAGMPSSSTEDRKAVEAIAGAGLSAKVSALARARRDDIDQVAACGAWGVRLSLPISDIQRLNKLHLDDAQYLKLALEMTAYAKQRGLECIFSPYDTTRCNVGFLQSVLDELTRQGTVDRVRLVDTTGCATPHVVRYLVTEMKKSTNIPIEVHCHNDFGLAVANTLAGAEAGAEYLSVTINGVGERAGNASLEETVLALKVLYAIEVGIRTELLFQTSQLVEERTGIALQAHKAVVGRGAFAHESGMVVAGLLKEPFTAECYVPELVGQKRRVVLGKKSGAASVQAKLGDIGLEATDEQLRQILEAVKSEAVRNKKPLDDKQFAAIFASILAVPGSANR